ncbi:hypothetical protein KWU72_17485 [Clostridioides difficile]|nr:hypothetical protein [Clostridioides difficile]
MLNLIKGMSKKCTRIFQKSSKKIKKCVVTSLCIATAITGIPSINAFASEPSANNKKDIYSEEFTETINIEGINYTYKYYYNEDGNRSISISDNTRSIAKTLTYDEKTSTIYLDDEKVAEVKTTNANGEILDTPESRTNWNLIGTYHKYITWANGIAAAALAAVISVAIGGVPVSGVIASCELSVLGIIAAGSVGGTLHWTGWYYTSTFYWHYKYDWAFKAPTGERYGTYHIYFNLE